MDYSMYIMLASFLCLFVQIFLKSKKAKNLLIDGAAFLAGLSILIACLFDEEIHSLVRVLGLIFCIPILVCSVISTINDINNEGDKD